MPRLLKPTRPRRLLAAAVAALTLLAAACSSTHHSFAPLPKPIGSPIPPSPGHPNIVFVLTDDLSWNLVQYMPHVLALEHRGMTFTNYTVTDSLCCPSRASIFSGRFPHDTHVLENLPPYGGFPRFHNRGEERSTFATDVYDGGYRTGFIGKYLNGYYATDPPADQRARGAWVPPGWTMWSAAGDAYREFNYAMTAGHAVVSYGSAPRDYLTTVAGVRATRFIRASARVGRPFLLEVATFAPHKPYVPAPADRGTFAGIQVPRTPAFNRLPSPAPQWMRYRKPLTARTLKKVQHWWQLRVESVQSVDRMIGDLERTLQRTGQADNTVFVFSSDNGYHLGDYTLGFGKQSAFDTDIRVPLIVAGPGIPHDAVNTDMAENIDLRPTFDQLAGMPTPLNVDGHSLVPLLHGQHVPWRTYALIEHHFAAYRPADPDRQETLAGLPPTYSAIRSPTFLYVEYSTGDREYYDLTKDPYELHNLGPSLSPAQIATLDGIVGGLTDCHTGLSCWAAGMPK